MFRMNPCETQKASRQLRLFGRTRTVQFLQETAAIGQYRTFNLSTVTAYMFSFEFRTRSELTPTAFEQAPVWVMYEDQEQANEIASWGVDFGSAWHRRSTQPDPYGEYFYPYLGKAKVDLVRGIYIGATAETFSCKRLPSYLTGGFAFALFCGTDQVLFNVNLLAQGQEATARIARHLNVSEHHIFPIIFQT